MFCITNNNHISSQHTVEAFILKLAHLPFLFHPDSFKATAIKMKHVKIVRKSEDVSSSTSVISWWLFSGSLLDDGVLTECCSQHADEDQLALRSDLTTVHRVTTSCEV